jgi:hypothetical protein
MCGNLKINSRTLEAEANAKIEALTDMCSDLAPKTQGTAISNSNDT